MSQETAHDLAVVIGHQSVCTGGRRVSQWILQAAVAPTARPIYIIRGRKDAGPGVRFLSPDSLFCVIAKGLMSRLQSVQNAAARLVSAARRYHHITPVLQELQWNSVRRRVISRWPPSSTCHCPASLQPTWPPTASWSPTKAVVSCVLPHQRRAL